MTNKTLYEAFDIPEDENLIVEDVPEPIETRKVLIPQLTSMTKFLFDKYRIQMYRYVNHLLKTGELSRITGEDVRNQGFNGTNLRFPKVFPDVSYWRIDRETFYADVRCELTLKTKHGKKKWNGYLVLWCGFPENEEFYCEIVDLAQTVDRSDPELVLLSPYLIPYRTKQQMEGVAAGIWKKYGMEQALQNPSLRDAKKLAAAAGLQIEYHPIYDHKGVDSIIFFKEDDLIIGEDRIEKNGSGKKKRIRARNGKPIRISANTIVINTNRVPSDYSSFDILHEIIHYEEHYLFFRLEDMCTNDPRKLKMKEVEIEKDKEVKDPVYFMEKQANRGAYALMMPASDTARRIREALAKTDRNKNTGARFEETGIEVARQLAMPHFRMRARMIQLGFIEAYGALNYVERRLITPFAFDADAWQEVQHTFVISQGAVNKICTENAIFKKIMDSGQYVYADGHVVMNDSRFVFWKDGERILTDEALDHINACCLRFVKVYVQNYIGRYVLGRMYSDDDYIVQTKFYLRDLMELEHLDQYNARLEYKDRFPKDFKKAVQYLLKYNQSSIAKLAEYFSMDNSTLGRWLEDPGKYRNEDFLTMLCLYFKLPDWISKLVFKRAHMDLDEEDDKRTFFLHEILRMQSNDGLDAANDFLKRHGQEPLHI